MANRGLSSLSLNLRKTLNHRITVLVVTVILAFFVLWQTGSLVWKLWLLTDDSQQTTALVPIAANSSEPESFQNLQRFPLIKSRSITTQGSVPIDAPKTSLKLKLVGLMYSTDENQARAIIESDKDGARSYAIHERVADKAEIYSIESDRVILSNAGKKEALLLDPDQKTSGSQAGAGDQPVNDPTRIMVSSGTQAASSQSSNGIPKTTADLMKEFSATPVMENGELQGFRLKALRQPEIMKELGIGPDDVITAVNGIALNTPGRVMVLYDKLKKKREFKLTLNHNRTVTVDMVDLYE